MSTSIGGAFSDLGMACMLIAANLQLRDLLAFLLLLRRALLPLRTSPARYTSRPLLYHGYHRYAPSNAETFTQPRATLLEALHLEATTSRGACINEYFSLRFFERLLAHSNRIFFGNIRASSIHKGSSRERTDIYDNSRSNFSRLTKMRSDANVASCAPVIPPA
jgi:hypothetical protein